MHEIDPQIMEEIAIKIDQRLPTVDLKKVIKEIDQAPRNQKSVQRIIVETENRGQLLRTRIDDEDLSRFLVDLTGPDLLTHREMRFLLALRATDGELDSLYDFSGVATSRGTSTKALAKCVAERKWKPGKRWARHFVSVLGLPRVFAGVSSELPAAPDIEDVEPYVPLPELEDFQENLRDQAIDMLSAPPGSNRAVLTLPTGAGKTRTTVEALIDWWLRSDSAGYILWIAQSDELCEQAIQAFREVWIDRGDQGIRKSLRLYRLWGGRNRVPDENTVGVIVSTIDKLRSILEKPSERQKKLLHLASDLGVVVIDEAHRAEALSYRRTLQHLGIEFTAKANSDVPVLGLTATPLRSQQNETLRLSRRFYSCLLRPSNLPEDSGELLSTLRDQKILSQPVHKILPHGKRKIKLTEDQERYLEDWKDLHPNVLVKLGQEKTRNRQIIDMIMELNQDWPVLFFGCSVQHAKAIAVLLQRRNREAAVITAGTRVATRRYLIDLFKKGKIQVLCNYGVLTTGFDAPRVRAIVVARPTTSRVLYEQMIGRGMRGPRFYGTEECLVIDVEDNIVHTNGKPLSIASQCYEDYWTKRVNG